MFSAGLVINLPSNYTGYYSGLHVTRFSENIAVVDTVLYVNERKKKDPYPLVLRLEFIIHIKKNMG